MGYRVMTNNQKGLDFERKCYNKLKEIGFSDLQLTRNTDNGADIVGRIMGKYMLFSARIMERDTGTDVCKRQLLRDGYIGLIGVL